MGQIVRQSLLDTKVPYQAYQYEHIAEAQELQPLTKLQEAELASVGGQS